MQPVLLFALLIVAAYLIGDTAATLIHTARAMVLL